GDARERADLRRLPRPARGAPDVLPRPLVHRQPARLRRGARKPRPVRTGRSRRPRRREEPLARGAARADRLAGARGGDPAVRLPRRRRVGRRPGREGAVRLAARRRAGRVPARARARPDHAAARRRRHARAAARDLRGRPRGDGVDPAARDRRRHALRGLFVTGTDTGVGKTLVTAAVGLALRERGVDVGVVKPVETGDGDAATLKELAELPEAVGRVRELAGRHAFAVVEGAGGLLVPVGPGWTIADLALALGLPLLVVARAGLGTVNHTCLTVAHARRLGLEVHGVVLNGRADESTEANAELI